MPYTPRKSDILYERLEVWLEECVQACLSPEETFNMLHEAWQYRIEQLQKEIKKPYERMYLKYRQAPLDNRKEPIPDEPKTEKPFIEVLDIDPKVPCTLCGQQPCLCPTRLKRLGYSALLPSK